MKVDNDLWVEKWRPQELQSYIGNDNLKETIESFIESGNIPHLLFFGGAGGGKTTLAKLITKSIDCDELIINASDENNVETIRTKVKGFASTKGFRNGKVVILDEFDYMSNSAQAILRNMMEKFSENCRFVLTCNYIDRVIEPIQSRCQTFEIEPPNKKDVIKHLSHILKEEKVKFETKDVETIVDSSFPDLRKIINIHQQNSTNGTLKLHSNSVIDNDIKSKILDILKSNDDDKSILIRKLINDRKINDFTELYKFLYDEVDEYGGSITSKIILILSDTHYKDAMVIEKEIIFMSCIIKIVQSLNELKNSK